MYSRRNVLTSAAATAALMARPAAAAPEATPDVTAEMNVV